MNKTFAEKVQQNKLSKVLPVHDELEETYTLCLLAITEMERAANRGDATFDLCVSVDHLLLSKQFQLIDRIREPLEESMRNYIRLSVRTIQGKLEKILKFSY